jgi:regulator of sigma E protease
MNFLLAGIIFSILFFVWVKPVGVNDKIQTNYDLKLIPTYEQSLEIWLLQKNWWIILQPVKDSISEKSGFKIWDNITKVNGNLITSAEEFIDIISKNPDKELEITYNPYCKTCENSYWDEKYLLLTPSPEGKIWAYISENISLNTNFQYQYWFTDSVKYGFSETYYQTLLTFRWIWILIKKIFNPETPQERQEAIEQVSGPIGIVDFISNSLSEWAKFILIIWAIISINLWVFNLLPIPALDGWRFIFITINGWIQKLFGKKAISQQVENYIHVWFFIFLIALSILIAYNDISKIINQ